MREIKFRAWPKKALLERRGISNASYDEFTIRELMSGTWNFEDYERFDRSTSLRDKNGVEVYEGDIVTCASGLLKCPHEIFWREATPFDAIGGWGLRGTNSTYDWIGEEEVIGNIYENPELLNN